MTVKLSPQTEAALNAQAVQRGVDVAALIEQIVEEQLASVTLCPAWRKMIPLLRSSISGTEKTPPGRPSRSKPTIGYGVSSKKASMRVVKNRA